MSFTTEYQDAVKARGWVYLPQLPGNTPLGKSVAGAPGARSVNTRTVRSTFEVAPMPVRVEQGFLGLITSVENHLALSDLKGVEELEDFFAPIVEATGLDHGVPGVLAKALGIPPWVLLIVLLVVGYAVLQQYRIVPPVRQLIS